MELGLLEDFACLDQYVQHELLGALENIQKLYIHIYEARVNCTVESWKKEFNSKCPNTVARFIDEYRADAEEYMKRTMPSVVQVGHMATSFKQYKKLLREFRKDEVNREETLYDLAGDKDDDPIQISSHVEARIRLVDRFLADEKNTAILTGIANDEEGQNAVYTKIGPYCY